MTKITTVEKALTLAVLAIIMVLAGAATYQSLGIHANHIVLQKADWECIEKVDILSSDGKPIVHQACTLYRKIAKVDDVE